LGKYPCHIEKAAMIICRLQSPSAKEAFLLSPRKPATAVSGRTRDKVLSSGQPQQRCAYQAVLFRALVAPGDLGVE
jgi:hypothetical protein